MICKKYFVHSVLNIAIFLVSDCGSTEYASRTPPAVDLASKKKTEKLNEVIIVSAATKTATLDDYRKCLHIGTIKGFISFGKGF